MTDYIQGKEVEETVTVGTLTYTVRYREPDKMTCVCGSWVTLDSSWANGCSHCEREYNVAGQLLAPRRFWGEETREQF